MIQTLKRIKDVLYFPIQEKRDCIYSGNVHCGFYIEPKLINKNSIVYSFGIGEDRSRRIERSIRLLKIKR